MRFPRSIRSGGRGLILLAGGLALLAAGRPATFAATARAFNTVVVINTNSPESIELGNYYAAVHGIPSHHICPVDIATNLSNFSAASNFYSQLWEPLTHQIATNGLNGQIDYVVLCYNLPTRVRDAEGVSSCLFYGFKNIPTYWEPPANTCKLPDNCTNAYYLSERTFRSADSWNATNGFIAFHLFGFNLDQALQVADRGAAAQAARPPASINLAFLGDQFRGVREQRFENTRLTFASLPGLVATCSIPPAYTIMSGNTNAMGYQDGFSNLMDPVLNNLRTNNVWLPGAFADHMTSYGGRLNNLSNDTAQSTVLNWLETGLTASYGTVTEPCNYLEKFPDPLLGFFYARGFTVGEAYAMAVAAPVHGLMAGDPLAAPYAAPPVLTMTAPAPNQIVTGTIAVVVSATPHPHGVPAAAMDLYLDQRFHSHLTAVLPTPGNIARVVVGDRTNVYEVATNDALHDVVAGLAAAINSDTSSVVVARAHGDRLELKYKYLDHAGDHLPVSAEVGPGSATELTLSVGLAATSMVPSVAHARKTLFLQAYPGGANTGDTVTCILTLTNGVAVTNRIAASQGESAPSILERLRSAITNSPELAGTDGVRYDRLASSAGAVYFKGGLFARTPGPDGYGIQVEYTINAVSNASGLRTNASFFSFLDENPGDLVPRASILFHLTPTNGILESSTLLDTTLLSEGVHSLDVIARDGSAVAAASRHTRFFIVGNASPQLAFLGTNGVAVTNGEPPSLVKGTDFGAVEWPQTRTNHFSLHNNGTAALVISNCVVSGPGAAAFAVENCPAMIDAGATSNFSVTFAPPTSGVYQAALAFESDALVPQTNILLSGTGSPRAQSIDFPPIPDQFTTSIVHLAATAESGLPVQFAVASGPGQIADGTNLTFTGPGIVAIEATQPGDANWLPASPATNAFNVYGTYLLTIHSEHGDPTPPAGVHTNWHGTVITNSITEPPPAGGTQWVCTGWALGGHEPASGTGTVFVMTATNDATLIWLWMTNYWLDVGAGPGGSVDTPTGWQPAGLSTQLTALPDLYYHFVHWTGSVFSTDNPLPLEMDGPKTLHAHFAATLAALGTPHAWLAAHGWTNDFDTAELLDFEPDGYPNWQEYIADTDPTNAASYPHLQALDVSTPEPILTWPASSARVYQVHYTADLLQGHWATQQLPLGTGQWTDTNPPAATSRYYRIAPLLP